jgi:hypothetical protein
MAYGTNIAVLGQLRLGHAATAQRLRHALYRQRYNQ